MISELFGYLFVFALGGLTGAVALLLTYRKILKDPTAAHSFLNSFLIARPELSLLACESCKKREIDALVADLPNIPVDRE